MTAAVEQKVIVKDRIWPALRYRPNPAQEQIHAAPHRHRIAAAGRRIGKSTCGGHELVPEAYRAYFERRMLEDLGKRAEYWIVGPTYTDAEKEFRTFYNDCTRLKLPFDRPGTYYDQRSGDMTISLWGGRFLVSAKSSQYPERLVGEGLYGVIMAEAAKMKQSTWTKYVRPTLADFRGWSLWNSTPEGKNWFYELWQRGQDPAFPNWWSIRAPSWMNHFIYPEGRLSAEILELEAELSPEMFNQEIGAEFSAYAGRVFAAWDEEKHVGDFEFRTDWPLYIATDYGWTNPNVALFIQTDPFDRVYVIAEYYRRHRSPEEFAADLLNEYETLCRRAMRLYPDPEDPAASYTLSNKLGVTVAASTGGELKTRLELIRRWLKDENPHLSHDNPERRPKLMVDRSCTMLIKEMDAYRYPERKNQVNLNEPENPMKKDDHAPEALGRFFAGHYGAEAAGGRPRQARARTSRSRAPQRVRRR